LDKASCQTFCRPSAMHRQATSSSGHAPVNRQASTGGIILRGLELLNKILQTQLPVML
jgi:hypothetical protein